MTTLRSKDYSKAINVLIKDQIIITLAQEVAKAIKPEFSSTLDFMRKATKEYHARGGQNTYEANHHIGAVAEAIQKINGWL